jgi:hypothetical protein
MATLAIRPWSTSKATVFKSSSLVFARRRKTPRKCGENVESRRRVAGVTGVAGAAEVAGAADVAGAAGVAVVQLSDL